MCGCGKGVRNVRNIKNGRPIVSPRQVSIQGPAVSPRRTQVNAQSASTEGLTTEMREREKQRREALLKKLGRL
jgi:hypothetical protein